MTVTDNWRGSEEFLKYSAKYERTGVFSILNYIIYLTPLGGLNFEPGQ